MHMQIKTFMCIKYQIAESGSLGFFVCFGRDPSTSVFAHSTFSELVFLTLQYLVKMSNSTPVLPHSSSQSSDMPSPFNHSPRQHSLCWQIYSLQRVRHQAALCVHPCTWHFHSNRSGLAGIGNVKVLSRKAIRQISYHSFVFLPIKWV